MLLTVPVVRFLLGSWSSLSVLFRSASAKLIVLSLFRKRSLGSRFPLVELNQLVLADWVYSGLTKFLFYLGQWQLLFSLESELWLFIVKQFCCVQGYCGHSLGLSDFSRSHCFRWILTFSESLFRQTLGSFPGSSLSSYFLMVSQAYLLEFCLTIVFGAAACPF